MSQQLNQQFKEDKQSPFFNVVLTTPDIPGNTGSIGRSCLGTNCRLILIHPLGFDLSEKAVRRAGLDYWKYVDLVEYDSWQDFFEAEELSIKRFFLFTKTSKKSVFTTIFNYGDYLIFGSETRGLPKALMKLHNDKCIGFPMFSSHIRSLNLANIVTSSIYLALASCQPNKFI